MSHIEGTSLSDRVWRNCDKAQQADIRNSLQSLIRKLRAIPVPPSTRIGGIGGEIAPLVYRTYNVPPSFATVSAMYQWLADELATFAHPTCETLLLLRSAPTTSKLVFTHGDIATRNLIVRDGKLVGLVDWDTAGWYPDYFEATMSVLEERIRPGHVSKLVKEMVPIPDEALVEMLVHFCRIAD